MKSLMAVRAPVVRNQKEEKYIGTNGVSLSGYRDELFVCLVA
jgi:hypothetical protein